jgi:hypothetical protein
MAEEKAPLMTAADQSQVWMPPLVVPGLETSALARFHWDCAWTGTVEPNMMGTGSPRMAAVGRARFTWTADGLWLRGEFVQDQFIADRLALTWQAHYLIGWDPQAGDYVAFQADNCGHAVVLRGRIEGDRLVLATSEDAPVRFRVTWDLTDPATPRWIDEVSVAGGPWQIVEQYVLTPSLPER